MNILSLLYPQNGPVSNAGRKTANFLFRKGDTVEQDIQQYRYFPAIVGFVIVLIYPLSSKLYTANMKYSTSSSAEIRRKRP